MRVIALVLVLALVLLPGLASADVPADVFLREEQAASQSRMQRLIVDLLLGRPGATQRLEIALQDSISQSAKDRREAYLQLCGAYFREQRFEDGIRVGMAAEALEKGSAGNMVDLHRAYQRAGPLRWSADSIRIKLRDGQLASARRGKVAIGTLIDSGAEIGLVSVAIAKKLHARELGAKLEVGTTTTAVTGGLVQIDSLEVGNATLLNLTALVISDEQAGYIGSGLILPMQALVEPGRLAYADHGTTLLLGRAAPPLGSNRTRLYWDESGIGFAARFSNGIRGVHLDTGSKRTWLFPAARAVLSRAERATRKAHQRTIGGVGGERVEPAELYRQVEIAVAGRRWRFPEIEMAAENENGEAARVGTGILDRFATVVLDFRRMEMSVED